MKTRTIYEAFDGKRFDSEVECSKYEQLLKKGTSTYEVTCTATVKFEGMRLIVNAPTGATDSQIVEKIYKKYGAEEIIDNFLEDIDVKAILWHVKIE